MRYMGLDVGSKTVGVAVSDPFGWTAQGIEIVKIDEEIENFGIERIAELIEEYRVEAVVIGLPKNMNNSIGPRAEASQKYGQLIIEQFDLPVFYQDERLTTVQAERMLIANDVSRKKRKKVIDKLAAVLILQNFLDAHPS